MRSELFNNLDAMITQLCTDRYDTRTLGEWERVKRAYIEDIPKMSEELKSLQERDKQLAEPPLRYAIYLGPCPNDPRYLIIGIGGTRMEVSNAEPSGISTATLQPGQLVVLSKTDTIVDVRSAYVCGEAGEVINILKEDEEAEVLRVITGSGQQLPKLFVKWREGAGIEVMCSEALARTGVQRGSIVRIDPDSKMAVAHVKPRLHVKVAGNEGTVVEISDQLLAQGVRIGDIVRVDTALKFAFEKLPAYETGKLTLEEVPDITYEDIGGLDDQIEHIYDAIELPYLYREQFEQYQLARPKGILLYGPPGCGKTMVAKAVANSLTTNIRTHLTELEQLILLYKSYHQTPDDPAFLAQYRALRPTRIHIKTGNEHPDDLIANLADYLKSHDVDLNTPDEALQRLRAVLAKPDGVRSFFLNIKGPELLDKYVGETEYRIRKIFEEARQHSSYYTPVVVFFDEMDAMFRTRGSGRSSDIETTIVPQFLSEIDGVESTEHLIVIGASNRQDMIDPAILRPGRLDVKIKVDRPSRKSAQDIFAMYLLPTLPLSATEMALPALTNMTAGEVIFRTAYRTTQTARQRSHNELTIYKETTYKEFSTLLPPGFDLRLALRFSDIDVQILDELLPTLTIREVLEREQVAELLPLLRHCRGDLEIGVLLSKLRAFFERGRNDDLFQQRVIDCIQQEWAAETLLLRAVELIYNPVSAITTLIENGTKYTFPLRDFMSGAIIANIVTRTKRQAIKRAVLQHQSATSGIGWQDLLDAIRQEFTENQDQFVRQKLTEEGRTEVEIQNVEVNLETKEIDPWNEEKIALHQLISVHQE